MAAASQQLASARRPLLVGARQRRVRLAAGQRTGRAGLRKFFHKGTHSFGNGIEDPLKIGPRLDQSVTLAVDMPVIKMRGGHDKFASLANRRGFAHGGVYHSVG